MTQRLIQAAAVSFTLAMAAPVQAQDETTADTVVATVDGTEITLGHMILLRQSLPQQYGQLPDEVLFQGILDQLVQQTALSKSYEGDTPRSIRLALENEERGLIAAKAVRDVLSDGVTDEAIQQAYDDTYGNAEPETEYKAAHILVETEEEARAIVEELNGGGDFAELAQEKSTGPSAPNGGELGWFGKGMMVAPFEEAVVGMEPGAVSEPVQTQFGWHVIQLQETRTKDAPALEDVRDELRGQVEQQLVKAHIDALVENANVDTTGADAVDPAQLSNIDLLE
ncbi:PPIC-type PPIASE domain protein [Pseudooceanicola batsensis HTCC2597]|uniref:Parvulin-like PPIase n=1 Tax=Pseudooceanicola batsensis (strain ATCC BAA-863 / DSM 15984 / KCTC 12145 / HTCC2597) TaxID=252305 RepID=A3TWL0_PSEBH|nr:peptidylprolyl isomerase [Pseudooceanicola batsensis]EAQ04006.1 PPIC-type PPIASE domain protein [Pseudooceanicola batsensis HTCC2597]